MNDPGGRVLGKLEQVDLRRFWTDEARDFTTWLADQANLDQLAQSLGLDLEIQGREVSVGPYRADIVARDVITDAKVIIENQLEKSNHDHLGKIITYASGLNAKIIIWIAKEFTEEHRGAIDFLNENAAPNLRFFAIEMQLWRIDNSAPAPLFKLIASPNESVSQARVEQQEGLTETKSLYREFWAGLVEFSKTRGTSLRFRKPPPKYWFSMATGRSKVSLKLIVSAQKKRLSCEIYFRGLAKPYFHRIREQQEAIEAVTGPLDWRELAEGGRVVLVFPHAFDVNDKSGWPTAFSWLKEKAELFYKVFAPRIASLPLITNAAEDSLGEDEEFEDEPNDA